MDPLTILAGLKAGISAGKEIASLAKGIGELFDSIDDARNHHEKKASSPFSSANEEAMDSYIKLQQAKDAEEQLRQIVIATRGYSGWQELLQMRAQIRRERKEREAAQSLVRQERFETIAIWGGVGLALAIMLGIGVVVILGVQGRL